MRIYIPKKALYLLLVLFTLSAFRYGNAWFEFSKYLEIFSNVYKTVQEDYVDEVPPSELAQIAIRNMLKSLDPYTVFYSEYQAEEAMIERQGEFGGVGCRIALRNKLPVVIEIEKGYGFDLAGVQHGDVLLKVDETPLKNLAIDELMQYFRGAPNSSFKLSLITNNKDTLIKSVTRSHVEQKSVSYHGILENQYGYIKLDEFGRDCSKEIASALKSQIDSHKIKGVVLDLRNNGGGLLNEAVDIVGLFVPKNTPIVTLKGAHKEGQQSWNTQQEPIAPELPVVVLINGSSASASEVVSGSLQDLDRAVIIGSPSFGKGLVQNYKNLPYRTQMKITTARYHIPSGRCIQKINYSKTETNNTSQSFKTKKGRHVTDGNGVIPDVNIQTQNEQHWISWMQKEYLYFDYVNQKNSQFKDQQINDAFTLLSDFSNFATVEGSKRLTQKINEQITQQADSMLFKDQHWVQIQNEKIAKSIGAQIKEMSSWHLYELRKAFYERRLNKSDFYQKMLSLDPLIHLAKNHLADPQKIQKILQP